jgi:chromosome transmission fidelity protein 1
MQTDMLMLQLLGVPSSPDVRLFSCGHIVPDENLTACIIGSGPSGRSISLSFDNRGDAATIDEIGNTIFNLCAVVPDGVVVFFPSYTYASSVHARWEGTGLAQRIRTRKHVVIEPRESSSIERTLAEYSRLVERNTGEMNAPRGAVLFAVVGGKMSEGINFADALGRCVVVVGLPFANPNDPVMKERLTFLKRHGESETKEFLDDLCMKSVNQSIGRVLRHRNDYAAIVLLDLRYTRAAIQRKLPRWVSERLASKQHDQVQFPSMFASVAQFFASKRPQQEQLYRDRASKQAK